MIFVGFGFLMTFMHKYAHSSIGFNFLLSVFTIQWGILVVGLLHNVWTSPEEFHTIQMDITTLIGGDFACGAVLISMGAVLGKVS